MSLCLSLSSPEWNTVSIEEQKRLDRVRREDGEFWWVCSAIVHLNVSLWQTSLLTLSLKSTFCKHKTKHSYLSVPPTGTGTTRQTSPWLHSCSHILICKEEVRKENKQAVTDDDTKLHKQSSCNTAQYWFKILIEVIKGIVSFLKLMIWRIHNLENVFIAFFFLNYGVGEFTDIFQWFKKKRE